MSRHLTSNSSTSQIRVTISPSLVYRSSVLLCTVYATRSVRLGMSFIDTAPAFRPCFFEIKSCLDVKSDASTVQFSGAEKLHRAKNVRW